MGMLRVCLFGCVKVAYTTEHNTQPLDARLPRSLQALFAYLLLQRQRFHSRDTLAGLFWGDYSQERARNCLNTALWRLRRTLETDGTSPGTYLITNYAGEVGFNLQSPHWLDVAAFEDQIHNTIARSPEDLAASDIAALESSLQLYTGDLLEGIFDDWALREREYLRYLYLRALSFLMGYYRQQGIYEQSIVCGQKILAMDPLREEIHRELMRLYQASGQRALAVRQYENCSQVLRAELGIAPMPETSALYELIAAGDGNGKINLKDADQAISFQAALRNLNDAIKTFEQAHQQLQHAMWRIEKLEKLAFPEEVSNR